MSAESFARKVATQQLAPLGIRSVSDDFIADLIERTCQAADCDEDDISDEDLRIEIRRMVEEITSAS